MATDKPEVVAWTYEYYGEVMLTTIDQTEVNAAYAGVLPPSEPLIRLSDYEALQAECEQLRKLVSECAEYLDTNEYTSIHHGSVLHRKLISASEEGTKQ